MGGSTDAGQRKIDWTELKECVSSIKQSVSSFPRTASRGLYNLFPCISWLPRYSKSWIIGDLISGLTVGIIVLPQSLAYAKIASLPPQYGLYTAVSGVLFYPFLSTCKDMNVGPSSVLSLLTAQLISSQEFASQENMAIAFALCLCFLAGLYQVFIGLFRLGWIVDCIPVTVISGFTTGAAISIIISQIPGLLGIPGIDVNQLAPYQVIYHVFRSIHQVNKNAIIGFSCMLFLSVIKFIKTRWGHRSRFAYYLGISSNGAAVIIYTLVSYLFVTLVYHNEDPGYSLIGQVPRGLRGLEFNMNMDILSRAALPAFSVAVIAMVDHIAIAKSFSAKNNYAVDCNQEILALGLTSCGGSFMGAYPMAGSFTRSAIKVSSGVHTPFDGIFTLFLVLGALFFLTPVFYYIPSAILPAIIIVSMSDLVARYPVLIELWNISMAEFLICMTGMIVTVLSTIAIGLYTSIAMAFIILFYRMARPRLSVLETTAGDCHQFTNIQSPPFSLSHQTQVLVFKIEESLLFPNASFVSEEIIRFIRSSVSSKTEESSSHERLWCEDYKKKRKEPSSVQGDTLRGVVFDFSSVNSMDATAYHTLHSLRKWLCQHTGNRLDFHFVHVKAHLHRVVCTWLLAQVEEKQVQDVRPLSLAATFIHHDMESAMEAVTWSRKEETHVV